MNSDKTLATCGFSHFMLEQTAKNTFLTTFQSQEISAPIIFYKPLNQILIEKFVLTKSYQNELLLVVRISHKLANRLFDHL